MAYFICGIVIFIILLFSFLSYYKAFYSPYKGQSDDYKLFPLPSFKKMEKDLIKGIKKANEIPYQEVYIKSYDGLKLRGRYYHSSDDATLMIGFHGYRGTPTRDFSGGVRAYLEMGFNVLLPEQRAHCQSEGHTITFGVKESRDCLSWIEYANKRFSKRKKIILSGISMGASTVLLVTQYKLPKNVKGILADSPFSSPKAIIKKVCQEDMHIPFFLGYPFVFLGGLLFGHFNMNKGDIKKALVNNNLPVLLIHGEADTFVPCSMSQTIADNDKLIDIETFPNSDHGLSFVVDQKRYIEIVNKFVKKICK